MPLMKNVPVTMRGKEWLCNEYPTVDAARRAAQRLVKQGYTVERYHYHVYKLVKQEDKP